MRISPIIQNFLPKVGFKSNFSYSFYGVNFLGNEQDTFEHRPMSGQEFKKKFGHCMTDLYTGKKMLTNQQLSKMKSRGFFQGTIADVVKKLKPYAKDYLSGTELELYEQIVQASKRDPDFTLPQLFNFWYKDTRTVFRQEQKPYFDKIKELGAQLPPEYLQKFNNFMALTDKKLYDVPIIEKFSLKEFNYSVEKLTEKIVDSNLKNRINNVLALLNDESMIDDSVSAKSSIVKKAFDFVNKKVPMKKSAYYEKYMKHYEWDKDEIRIRLIENIMDAASQKNYKRLERLCANNIQKLKGRPVQVPFSNKTFRYDLSKILDGLEDEKLKQEILQVARELPSSKNSVEALILKYKDSDSDTIGDRMFNPSLVSVEHLLPATHGGCDLITNCALARRKYNYERMDEPLYITLQQFEHKHQQKYADNLIKLANKGLLSYEDVLGQLQTIETEGHIKLDYEKKLKKRELTQREERIAKYKSQHKK